MWEHKHNRLAKATNTGIGQSKPGAGEAPNKLSWSMSSSSHRHHISRAPGPTRAGPRARPFFPRSLRSDAFSTSLCPQQPSSSRRVPNTTRQPQEGMRATHWDRPNTHEEKGRLRTQSTRTRVRRHHHPRQHRHHLHHFRSISHQWVSVSCATKINARPRQKRARASQNHGPKRRKGTMSSPPRVYHPPRSRRGQE